jgi:hypothetical protein
MAYTIDRYPCEESPRLGAMTLQPTPESVPRARRWFRKFIAPYNPACSVDDCVLMISELVTNAIRYGRADEPWLVRVEWFREDSASARQRRARARPAAGRLDRRVMARRAQSLRWDGGLLRGRRCLAVVRRGTPLVGTASGDSSLVWLTS